MISNELTIKNYTLSHDALSSLEDRDKGIWIGTYQGGVLFYKDGLHDGTPDRYLDGLSVASIAQDYEGGLWFTTLENGIYYLPSNQFLTYTYASGLDEGKVACLTADSKNTMSRSMTVGSLP